MTYLDNLNPDNWETQLDSDQVDGTIKWALECVFEDLLFSKGKTEKEVDLAMAVYDYPAWWRAIKGTKYENKMDRYIEESLLDQTNDPEEWAYWSFRINDLINEWEGTENGNKNINI